MAIAGVRVSIPHVDRRTLIGAGLAAVAALLVLLLTRPTPTVSVLVAADDIPAGRPLDQADLTTRSVASSDGLVEGSSIGELSAWSVVAPLEAGEPLLPSLLQPPQVTEAGNLIAVAIEESHAVLGRLSLGDRIDIYVTWPARAGEPPITELLAAGVYVAEVQADTGSSISGSMVNLVLAVDDELAPQVARASRSGALDLVRVAS